MKCIKSERWKIRENVTVKNQHRKSGDLNPRNVKSVKIIESVDGKSIRTNAQNDVWSIRIWSKLTCNSCAKLSDLADFCYQNQRYHYLQNQVPHTWNKPVLKTVILRASGFSIQKFWRGGGRQHTVPKLNFQFKNSIKKIEDFFQILRQN